MTRLPLSVTLKAFAYVVVGVVAAVIMSNTLRVPVHGDTTGYRIAFHDAEGLTSGNPVAMASSTAFEIPSEELVCRNTSAPRITRATSSDGNLPRSRTRPPRSRSSTANIRC